MASRITIDSARGAGPAHRETWSVGAELARSLARPLLARIQDGQLSVCFPDGREIVAGKGASHAHIDVCRPRALMRVLVGGSTGLARAYIDGDWDSPDLVDAISLAARNQDRIGAAGSGFAALRAIDRIRHLMRPNTRAGSRRNIARHYDLGNDFYRLWLDPGMTYSSAVFDTPDADLEAAQAVKYRRLADSLDLRPGMHLLEIGCGWGGFAEMLAREYGCRVTAITVSVAQHDYAKARIASAGLAELVDVRLVDYRDVEGTFDRIASIEMLEAVGERNWRLYFECLDRLLAPGGIVGLQVITIEDRRFERYRRSADFIQTHIFPGGMLPSPAAMRGVAEMRGFGVEETVTFGSSYATTLARWRESFETAWPEIAALGFDERFRRTWRYYLAYCEAGFHCGAIDVGHYRLVRRTAA